MNVIPLNPTAGYAGKPTSKVTNYLGEHLITLIFSYFQAQMQQFIDVLATYGVTATARIRRGQQHSIYSFFAIWNFLCRNRYRCGMRAIESRFDSKAKAKAEGVNFQ